MGLDEDELEERRAAVIAAAAPANLPTHDRVQVDYFGASREYEVVLKDGVSTISHRTLMEGEKRQYMNAVNRDLVMNRQTNEAKLRLAPGDDRRELFKLAICGWNLVKDGRPYPFSKQNLTAVLNDMPPEILDDVEVDIRKHNPWLLADVTVEEIDKEIASLTELREQKVLEQEGNGDSSS